MKNFNQGKRGGRGGRRFDDRDSKSRSMHSAVCDECGNNCEVPFRPTGDKPIFCNECFQGKRGGASNKFDKKSKFSERKMYAAVCSKCGNNCDVPFRPTGGKPVYCDGCFGKEGGALQRGDNNLSKQFEILSEKLDKILRLLAPVGSAEVSLKKKAKKEIKNIESKKSSKKAVVKKSVKKAVAKKLPKKVVAKKKSKKRTK